MSFYLNCASIIALHSEEIPSFEQRRRFIHALNSLIGDASMIQASPETWRKLLEKAVDLLETRMKANQEEDRLDIVKEKNVFFFTLLVFCCDVFLPDEVRIYQS